MNVHIIFLILFYSSLSSSLPSNEASKSSSLKDSSIQSKRDLSLSYAATDIGSKDGSRSKTITVIKNIAGKKDEPIKVDPKLHKHENWGSEFRDNFDKYGAIPDVPDIDDLFEFVNKKKEDKKPKEKENPPAKKPEEKDKKPDEGKAEPEEPEEKEEPTQPPAPVEEDAEEEEEEAEEEEEEEKEEEEEVKEEKVEKIAGDAELIQPAGKGGKVKSQSLDLGKYRVREASIDDDDDDANPHYAGKRLTSSGKKSEKFIQLPAAPYNYPEPSLKGYYPPTGNSPQAPKAQSGRGSYAVTTPSGKSYDVPVDSATSNPPYLAPNYRRNPNQQFPSSSQRPYVAPSLRKPYEPQVNNTVPPADCGPNGLNALANRQPVTFNVYRNVVPNIRTDGYRGYRPRSRGLRYY